MKPIEFAGQNDLIGPSENYDDAYQDECGKLPVKIIQRSIKYEGKIISTSVYYSCWKPSEEELKILQAGGVIIVAVVGPPEPTLGVTADYVKVLS